MYYALRDAMRCDAMPKHEGLRLVLKYQPESLQCYYAPEKRPRAFEGRRDMIDVMNPSTNEAAE
jgi:hypothetical protein